MDNNTFALGASDFPEKHKYFFSYNFFENEIKNYISFEYNQSIDVKDSLILLCNQSGVVALLNKNIVPVKEGLVTNESYLKFNNNQLEYYSDKSFIGESMIFDTTGKLVVNLGTQSFVIDKNIIQINQSLAIGVYILSLKSGTEQFSYKFIVE